MIHSKCIKVLQLLYHLLQLDIQFETMTGMKKQLFTYILAHCSYYFRSNNMILCLAATHMSIFSKLHLLTKPAREAFFVHS